MQSPRPVALECTPMTTPVHIPRTGTVNWLTSEAPPAYHNNTQVNDHAWQDIDIDMPLNDDPILVTPSVPRVDNPRTQTSLWPEVSPTTYNTPQPNQTEAAAFIRARPGGPVQADAQNMLSVERRVSSQVQKKATASKEGHDALLTLGLSMAKQNKVSTPETSIPVKKRKPRNMPSKVSPRRTKVNTNKRRKAVVNTKKDRATVTLGVEKVVSCNYGCVHGGLVAMQQMQPYDTRHYLGEGRYLNTKHCLDCTIPISTLFEQSKRKAVVYYCQVDYNVEELTDDNTDKADNPCACILCVKCYFHREMKKNGTTVRGKTRRSSNRGCV
jgi:hypothetical protein